MTGLRFVLHGESRVVTNLAGCAHRSAEQGPLLGCERTSLWSAFRLRRQRDTCSFEHSNTLEHAFEQAASTREWQNTRRELVSAGVVSGQAST